MCIGFIFKRNHICISKIEMLQLTLPVKIGRTYFKFTKGLFLYIELFLNHKVCTKIESIGCI